MSGTPGTRKSGLVAIATSAVQSKPKADEAQSEARKAERMKTQEVIHGMRLHPLPGGKTDERRGEDDAHGRPVPAEQTTKGGIRQADRQQDENRSIRGLAINSP